MKHSPKARKTPLPEGFAISAAVQAWAEAKGFAEHLPDHFEQFSGYARAKAAMYSDWDQALINAIRDDWGDVRKRAGGSRPRLHHASELRADEQLRAPA